MTTVPLGAHFRHCCRSETPKFVTDSKKYKHSSLCYNTIRTSILNYGAKTSQFTPFYHSRVPNTTVRASANNSGSNTAVLDSAVSDEVIFRETFPLQRVRKVEGKIIIRLDRGDDEENWQLTVGCNLPGKWILHWGVNYVNDIGSEWDQPPVEMRPLDSITIKDYAIETPMTKSSTTEEGDTVYQVKIAFNTKSSIAAINFVLKDEETGSWYQYRGRDFKGNDFYIPIPKENKQDGTLDEEDTSYTNEIINEIRHLVTGISSEANRKAKTKEAQELILQEIEKLAAEAYSIFRSSIRTVPDIIEEVVDAEAAVKIHSATGTGFEILFQGFNWESNKSGKWYVELEEKAAELASLGFTVAWLPPPTESISPEGYMPRDLYNLNSRYGNTDELKSVVKKFHQVGIRVLGDAVINHRCAHYQNQNGIWNIFGGLLNWDDRAVVGDDPHFQGRGNKSSGDNFHAAPNIDHSQGFVRKDLCEWLCWLRKEIGYDGWRLDYVRGFWGGYVKEYMEASEPYFSVGEYWDSLSYTYGEMDHNQDAHRQRIVDWINDTNGTCGAFDVTTKGILHSAIERCEYWRLSDSKGKPPGVVGWWPSRAVTFIENHDTGSTQGHWRFPGGKEMQGYAYILTHPGTPSVFYDHMFSHFKSEISALMSLRKRNKIQCRSTVKIVKAERDVYAAIVDEKVAVKIGPGHYEPESGSQKWSLAVQGNDYKVWEAS
ncbi:putative glycosidase [Helianthus annuus]|nr:putative glycosidase [Helianthus annuus]